MNPNLVEERPSPRRYSRDRSASTPRRFETDNRASRSALDQIDQLKAQVAAFKEQVASLTQENEELQKRVQDFEKPLLQSAAATAANGDELASEPGWIPACEMLAVVSDPEAEQLMLILSASPGKLDQIMLRLGPNSMLRLVNLLGASRTAFVVGDQIVATEFGKALGRWIAAAAQDQITP